MNYSDKIRELRKGKGISQSDMADLIGISQAAYGKIESGFTKSISIEIGKGIARVLNVSFNELFEIEDTNSAELMKQIEVYERENFDHAKQLIKNKKELEEKDLLIDLLKKENQKLTEMQAWDAVFQMFDELLSLEIALRWGEPSESEQVELRQNIEENTKILQKEVKDSLTLRHISHESLLDIFLQAGLDDIIEDDNSTKENFIKNCTTYLNKFIKVSEDEVKEYIDKNVITRWDTKKRRKRALELKRLARRGAFKHRR